MDARIKSGHDGRVCCSIQFSNSQDVFSCRAVIASQTPSFRDGPQDQTSDAQLRIGESRDSGFDASHRPGMTESGSLPLRNDAKLKSTYDFSPSPLRGRGECRMPNAPAVSCAMVVVERTRVTTSTPETPGIPARNGFNGLLRAPR